MDPDPIQIGNEVGSCQRRRRSSKKYLAFYYQKRILGFTSVMLSFLSKS